MIISVDGIGELRKTPARERSFSRRPTEISPRLPLIDLFPGILSDIVDKDAPAAWLNAEGEGIAQSERPNQLVFTRRRAVEGIVRWNLRDRIRDWVHADDFA